MTVAGAPASNTRRAMLLVVFQLGVMAISLAVGVIVARALGVHDRGVYALALIPAQLLGSLVASAMSESTVYFVSGHRETPTRVLRVLVGFAALASAMLMIVLAALWFPLHGNALRGVGFGVFVAAIASTPCLVWTGLGQSYLFARGRTAASQMPLVCERIATVVAISVGVYLGAGLLGVVVLSSVGILCGAVATTLLIGRTDLIAATLRERAPGVGRRMTAYGSSLLLANLAQKLTYRLDLLIVNVVAGPATVGIYSVAARVAEVPLLAPRALRSSWVAARAREGEIGGSTSATLAGGRKLTIVMMVVLPLFAVVAAPLLPVLYGRDFAPAVPPLLVLLVATFALSTSFPFVSSLTGGGRPRQLAIASWAGLAVTICLDVVLVPPFGAVGAALASLGAYALFALIVFRLWRRQVRGAVGAADLVPRVSDVVALVAPLRERLRIGGRRAVGADS